MFLIGLAIVLTIVVFIGLGFGPRTDGYNALEYKPRKRQFFAVFALLIIVFGMFTTVNANEVGIVFDPLKGGLQTDTFDEGLHLKAPWIKVHTVSTKLKEVNFEVFAQTGVITTMNDNNTPDDISDDFLEETGGGQWATYQVTLQYRIEAGNGYSYYKKFGKEGITEATLLARLTEALQANSVKFDIFTILKGKVNDVKGLTEIDLIESLNELGLTVDAFIIRDIDAGPAIELAVEEEATAAKAIDKAQKDLEAQEIKNKMLLAIAINNAEVEKAEALGTAEAEKILKGATANAIYTMYEGQFMNLDGSIDTVEKDDFELNGGEGYLTIEEISTIVLQQLYYDAWDGVLPEVVAGDACSFILPSIETPSP